MNRQKFVDGFQLHNDHFVYEQIKAVATIQTYSTIVHPKKLLLFYLETLSITKLKDQTCLIRRFQ